jgi:hypothetical protein
MVQFLINNSAGAPRYTAQRIVVVCLKAWKRLVDVARVGRPRYPQQALKSEC